MESCDTDASKSPVARFRLRVLLYTNIAFLFFFNVGNCSRARIKGITKTHQQHGAS